MSAPAFAENLKNDAQPPVAALDAPKEPPTDPASPYKPAERHRVITGAERLRQDGFALIRGKRVGIITNQTGLTDDGSRLIDLLHHADNVKLAAVFSPEHGFAGTAGAGESVEDSVDKGSGVPVFSLYGATRKPTPEMLRNIDVLIFDIQDVGIRFYTFISTLGLAMQAAAKAGVPFLVLDRPNPLGGDYVSGFVTEDAQRSFVSQFKVPVAHGMTVGELAKLIHEQHLLPGLEKLQLEVLPMQGWERWMRWPDYSAAWVPTSPAINSFNAALLYGGIGFFEATPLSDGRGTQSPFTLIGVDWLDQAAMVARLNAQNLPGLAFEAAAFTPSSGPGRPGRPKFSGRKLAGIRILVTDYRKVEPVEAGMVVLQAFREQAKAKGKPELIDQRGWLAKLAGTPRLYRQLKSGASGEQIAASWKAEVDAFRALRAPYLLYR